jgi:hypothetical protein
MGAIWIVIVLAIVLFALLGLWRWNRARTPTVAVVPMCTILCEVMDGGPHGRVVVSDRDDPLAVNDFTPFRPMNPPLGDPSLPFAFGGEPFPDTLGISEAWLPFPGAPEVHRAQATLARNSGPVEPNFTGSAWNISVQASNGTWSLPFARGTANSGMEPDTFDAARVTVPQLMPVGVANLRMFACAGLRTEDGADRSTWLIEATAPNVARGTNGSSTPIQDLLHGDDRFVPNKPIPAQPLSPAGFGPATPPIPGVVGIGERGPVRCALRQLGDDVATRQLHMLTIENGTLYHSLASDFGPTTRGDGSVFNRFRAISAWGDVGLVLGGGFGIISSAAIVAQPSWSSDSRISVFFVAESSGRYRLFHTMRSSSGSWRQPPVEVLVESGDAPSGSVYEFQVSAGACPEPGATVWDDATTETVIALHGAIHGPLTGAIQVFVIRVVSAARQWTAGVHGLYSPWSPIDPGTLNGLFIIRDVVVTARPFRDDALPPP